MHAIRFNQPQPAPIAERPTTFTVRPLTEAEIAAAGGSIVLLLPAVQKIREAAAR